MAPDSKITLPFTPVHPNGDWEYDPEVWLALQRVLLSFTDLGYLETAPNPARVSLVDQEIPPVLKLVAT